MTHILRCSCTNRFQDRMYGIGMRVHNEQAKVQNMARCTVCLSSHDYHPGSTPKEDPKKKEKKRD